MNLSKNEHLFFLVGNKIDQAEYRLVSEKQGALYAELNKMQFAEISIKDPNTVEELLRKIYISLAKIHE